VAYVTEQYEKAGLLTRLRAIGGSVITGLAFSIDPLNPVESIVREAIRLATVPSRDALETGQIAMPN
jgi:hypothetical protein